MTQRVAYSRLEAAQMLGLSPRTIDRMVGDGRLRTTLLGGRRLIPAAELERIIGSDAGKLSDAVRGSEGVQ